MRRRARCVVALWLLHKLGLLLEVIQPPANERSGLDFKPPGGESPRDVQIRVAPLLARLAGEGRPTLAVTHRGVIRAIYAAAAGWDMTGDPPHRLDLYDTLQIFTLAPDGSPSIERLNVPLAWRNRRANG